MNLLPTSIRPASAPWRNWLLTYPTPKSSSPTISPSRKPYVSEPFFFAMGSSRRRGASRKSSRDSIGPSRRRGVSCLVRRLLLLCALRHPLTVFRPALFLRGRNAAPRRGAEHALYSGRPPRQSYRVGRQRNSLSLELTLDLSDFILYLLFLYLITYQRHLQSGRILSISASCHLFTSAYYNIEAQPVRESNSTLRLLS